ncbi:Caleosin related protein-domain-containing protein [Phycomyces nitens]|nr:Caleosin related protein-domain-containing protein [Phycomyces nitens]
MPKNSQEHRPMKSIRIVGDSPNDQATIQNHLTYWDRTNKGYITPLDAVRGFSSLGYNVFLSIIIGAILSILFSYATQDSWIPDPLFRVNTANLFSPEPCGPYDTNGQFDLEKFEALFTAYAKADPSGKTINIIELLQMVNETNSLGTSLSKWTKTFLEWSTVYLFVGHRGHLKKKDLLATYDGSLFRRLQNNKRPIKASTQKPRLSGVVHAKTKINYLEDKVQTIIKKLPPSSVKAIEGRIEKLRVMVENQTGQLTFPIPSLSLYKPVTTMRAITLTGVPDKQKSPEEAVLLNSLQLYGHSLTGTQGTEEYQETQEYDNINITGLSLESLKEDTESSSTKDWLQIGTLTGVQTSTDPQDKHDAQETDTPVQLTFGLTGVQKQDNDQETQEVQATDVQLTSGLTGVQRLEEPSETEEVHVQLTSGLTGVQDAQEEPLSTENLSSSGIFGVQSPSETSPVKDIDVQLTDGLTGVKSDIYDQDGLAADAYEHEQITSTFGVQLPSDLQDTLTVDEEEATQLTLSLTGVKSHVDTEDQESMYDYHHALDNSGLTGVLPSGEETHKTFVSFHNDVSSDESMDVPELTLVDHPLTGTYRDHSDAENEDELSQYDQNSEFHYSSTDTTESDKEPFQLVNNLTGLSKDDPSSVIFVNLTHELSGDMNPTPFDEVVLVDSLTGLSKEPPVQDSFSLSAELDIKSKEPKTPISIEEVALATGLTGLSTKHIEPSTLDLANGTFDFEKNAKEAVSVEDVILSESLAGVKDIPEDAADSAATTAQPKDVSESLGIVQHDTHVSEVTSQVNHVHEYNSENSSVCSSRAYVENGTQQDSENSHSEDDSCGSRTSVPMTLSDSQQSAKARKNRKKKDKKRQKQQLAAATEKTSESAWPPLTEVAGKEE